MSSDVSRRPAIAGVGQIVQRLDPGIRRATSKSRPASSPGPSLLRQPGPTRLEPVHLPSELLLESIGTALKVFLGLLECRKSMGLRVIIRRNRHGLILKPGNDQLRRGQRGPQ